MSSNEATTTSTGVAEHDFGGADRGGIRRIGHRQPIAAVGARNGNTMDSRRKRRENPSRLGVAASNCGRLSRSTPQ